jgi:hypothetical protein
MIRFHFGFPAVMAITIALAAGYNLLLGRWMIGADPLYMFIVCTIFAFVVSISTYGWAMRFRATPLTTPRAIVTGGATGAALYLANVLLGLNAGFTVKGLVVISVFGAISALGMLFANPKRTT